MVHRHLFGSCVDKLIIGWLLLFLGNVLLPMGGMVLDIIAIFSKIIILNGIISYDFAVITQKIRSHLTLYVPPITTGYGEDGGMELVMFRSKGEKPLMAVSKWIKNRIDENIKMKVETSIIVLQDMIPYDVLRSIYWKKPESIHIFIFSSSNTGFKEFPTLRFGITELGAMITEISRKQAQSKSKGNIILVDLSVLIHTHGVNQAYELFLNKMGLLRSSRTVLVAIFHPETHDEQVVALFKTITDIIIQA